MAEEAWGADPDLAARADYQRRLLSIRGAFEAGERTIRAGTAAIRDRSDAVDALIASLWRGAARTPQADAIAVLAVGGYGRSELFPSSDVDLVFLFEGKALERETRDAIRRVSQSLWDTGARAAPVTRPLAECERFDPENVEAALALLDARLVSGDARLFAKLKTAQAKLLLKDGKAIMAKSGRSGAQHATPEYGRHPLPSGAEHQGLPRRPA